MKLADGLPEMSFGENPTNGQIVVIKRGVKGYFPYLHAGNQTVDQLNAKLGVTPRQARAMMNGSMFGWNVPGADPENCLGE